MANKVLSIKMDEKDIERLRKYYEVLVSSGFLSGKTMSLNAFYKHLLLDYLEDDVSRAFATYSAYGITPRCINPESMDDNENFKLNNTYNLSEESFDAYKKCVKEALNRNINEMKENAKRLNDVVETDIFVKDGLMYEWECIPRMDMEEKCTSFWENKAFETMDLQSKEYRENEAESEISMIEKSSMPMELKQKLIIEINEYSEKKKRNYCIIQGYNNL